MKNKLVNITGITPETFRKALKEYEQAMKEGMTEVKECNVQCMGTWVSASIMFAEPEGENTQIQTAELEEPPVETIEVTLTEQLGDINKFQELKAFATQHGLEVDPKLKNPTALKKSLSTQLEAKTSEE